MIISLTVPDPPPTRERTGRAADRGSPNAGPLVRAAEAMVEANPGLFPLTFSSYRIVFGKTRPEVDGYEPHHAIYEVLQDVGLVIEPESWYADEGQDPSADFYVATYALADDGGQHPTSVAVYNDHEAVSVGLV